MIISKTQNYYVIKFLGKKIDVSNKDELQIIVQKIMEKILNYDKINHLVFLDFYLNSQYGTVIKLSHYKLPFDSQDEMTVKITIHTDSLFLYKIDYFDIQNYSGDALNIYYYMGDFYAELKDDISKDDYLKILELSEVVYEEAYNIIWKGIKI